MSGPTELLDWLLSTHGDDVTVGDLETDAQRAKRLKGKSK